MNISQQLQRLERDYINLANERLGAKAIYSTDEFFGAMQRMLNPAEPVFLPDEFDDHGKWMDGWETRRRRGGGHDECVARLGVPGLIRAVNIDTRHFTGNYPPQASLEACYSEQAPDQGARWTEIIPVSPLQGDSHNLFDVKNAQIWNHLRLKIHPDGGVARLRVYGYAYRDWSKVSGSQLLDLAAVENGGRAVLCNDEHFGDMGNIIMPGKGINMGDGWETRRRREPGHDWVVLQLGHLALIDSVSVDTAFFKGNYPDRISMDAARLPASTQEDPSPEDIAAFGFVIAWRISQEAPLPENMDWRPLLDEHPLSADSERLFREQLRDVGRVTHLRLNIHPDGGLSRVRVFGRVAR